MRQDLTDDEKAGAREIFEGRSYDRNGKQRSGCVHCAGIHDVVDGLVAARQPCNRVKIAKWLGDALVEVEYWPAGSWDASDVIFPRDVYEDDENEVKR